MQFAKLDDSPMFCKQRIGIEKIRKDPWLRKNYVSVKLGEDDEVNLDDVRVVFYDIQDKYVAEQSKNTDEKPLIMNAFEMMSTEL